MSLRVLVVDDSATVRRVVGRTLEQAGYEAIVAVDGRDALERASERVPDLVLVDFVMPHMNGFQFVQAMRAIKNLEEVPVVLMSAKADKIGDGFLAQTGALDAITKPFSPDALLMVAEHALSRWEQSKTRDTVPPSIGYGDGASVEIGPMDMKTAAAHEPSMKTVREISPAREDPVSESSPIILAHAARKIAERLADGLDEPALIERLEAMDPQALFDAVDAAASLIPGREGDEAFTGWLQHVALGEVLQMLVHQRTTGTLEVKKVPSRSGRAVSVCLRDGVVQLALGRVGEQEFRLGRYLLREELIDREDLERITSRRGPATRGLLGAQLVKLGYISGEELDRVLAQQTSELIYEALRWRRGYYRFVRFAQRPEADDANLGLPLASILMEGLRRVDEWRLIEEQIKSLSDVPRRDEEALRSVELDRFSVEERAVLEAIDAERTIRDIIEETKLGSFAVSKILFQMMTSRLVRV